jgi:hypothetical protein
MYQKHVRRVRENNTRVLLLCWIDTIRHIQCQGFARLVAQYHTPRSRRFPEANILNLAPAYADLTRGAFVDSRRSIPNLERKTHSIHIIGRIKGQLGVV